jgi:branched-subunit amino acid transport protein AzlD
MQKLPPILAALIAVQATLGLAAPTLYRDPGWIKATWFGNDWITLVVAAPLLIAAQRAAQAGSIRGELVRIGAVAYAGYNDAFYLFGAALNAFFPLYIIILAVAVCTLTAALCRVDPFAIAQSMRPATPMRSVGGYLIFVGSALALVWIGMWSAYVFAGRAAPVAPEAFKIVAALDLLWLVPSLVGGGALLWNRRPWGCVIAAGASIQGALYLLVLSVNSMVAIHRGFAAWPGELPIWAPLSALTWLAALLLVLNISPSVAVCRNSGRTCSPYRSR